MKFFVIGEEDVVLGFRYAGIEGRVVKNPEEAYEALVQIQGVPGIGIVIIQDSFSTKIQEKTNEIRFTEQTPLIVEIAGPAGRAEGRPSLLELIQEAVGMKV